MFFFNKKKGKYKKILEYALKKQKEAKEKKTTDTHTEQYLYTGRAVNVFFYKNKEKKEKICNKKQQFEKNV